MSRWTNKYVIGLTGNIAVGKSVVRQMLQHLGAYTIDADGLAHQAMSPGAPAYKPVVETFGQIILNPDKTINRAMLGSLVFSNPAMLQKLETITHPIIGQAISTLINRAKQKVIIIEAIKLLEGDLGKAADAIWVVDAKPQTQYTRLVGKRKMSEQDAKQRILAQNAQSEKLKSASVVINNDGNVEETWKQVQAAWNKIPGNAPEPPAETVATPATATPTPTATPTSSTPPAEAAKPAEAQPAAAQPTEKAASAPAPTTPAAPADTEGVTVKRGMPNNAENIANFINKKSGKSVGRMDVIMSFGQKSYLIAETSDQIVGLIGWQVENLITRADELYLEDGDVRVKVIAALVRAVEDASKELQSEVSFVFLPSDASNETLHPFLQSGYEVTTVKEIKVPAWREAVQEIITANPNLTILNKPLGNRILKPI